MNCLTYYSSDICLATVVPPDYYDVVTYPRIGGRRIGGRKPASDSFSPQTGTKEFLKIPLASAPTT